MGGPESPNLGHNQFSTLADSPPTKKRRPPSKTLNDFPELPSTNIANPKYIIISAKDSDKTISEYSCFAVHKALKHINKNINSITNLKDGNLLMLVRSIDDANKFINAKELPGICKIECQLHQSLNSVKGTIYAPYLINVPENEILEELASQKVIAIYKFTKQVEGEAKPSGVMLLTFELYNLPSKIDICGTL